MSSEVLAHIAETLGRRAKLNKPLATYSAIGIGGPADLLFVARDGDDLVRAVQLAREAEVPWRVFGGLTNMLLPDSGLRGVIILNRACNVKFDDDDCCVYAESGTSVVRLARQTIQRGWGGLTWAIGLPGTVGGAVVNNAGAFGGEISKILHCAEVLGPEDGPQIVEPEWFDYRYRCSKLKGAGHDWLVLGATFQMRPREREHLEKKAAQYNERRTSKQPPGKNLGSTFRNPPGDYAGRLIEAAGLKGARVGGMVVSDLHANFLINEGDGTAADFRELLKLVQDTVYEKFGVRLQTEIEMVPEEPPAEAG